MFNMLLCYFPKCFFILTLLSFHLALLPADGRTVLCNVHLPLFLPSSQPLFLCVSDFISSLPVFSWDIAYNLFHSAQLDFTAVPQVKAKVNVVHVEGRSGQVTPVNELCRK